MALLKAIHVVCDGCGAVEEDAARGRQVSDEQALAWAQQLGWSHQGHEDRCVRCQERAGEQRDGKDNACTH